MLMDPGVVTGEIGLDSNQSPARVDTLRTAESPAQHGPVDMNACNRSQCPGSNGECEGGRSDDGETLPLPSQDPELMAVTQALQQEAQQSIQEISGDTRNAPVPTAATPRQPRRGRVQTSGSSLRRSRPIAHSGIAGTAVDRAQTVLMRKLGILSQEQHMMQQARDAYA